MATRSLRNAGVKIAAPGRGRIRADRADVVAAGARRHIRAVRPYGAPRHWRHRWRRGDRRYTRRIARPGTIDRLRCSAAGRRHGSGDRIARRAWLPDGLCCRARRACAGARRHAANVAGVAVCRRRLRRHLAREDIGCRYRKGGGPARRSCGRALTRPCQRTTRSGIAARYACARHGRLPARLGARDCRGRRRRTFRLPVRRGHRARDHGATPTALSRVAGRSAQRTFTQSDAG